MRLTTITAVLICVLSQMSSAATPPVPAEFQDLYDSMNSQISTFDTAVRAGWDGTRYPTVFSSQLLTAESSNYTNLLATNYYQYSVLPELQEVQALGAASVTVHINFPLLSPDFHNYAGTNMQEFVNFYQQLAQDIHARGMKLIVETSVGAPMPGNEADLFTPYLQSLSWDAYRAGRATTARNVAELVRPDYISVLGEPDTEAAESFQSQVFTTDGYAQIVTQILQAIRASSNPGVKVGAGCGTWINSFTTWVPVCATLPGLDFADMHIYPTNRSFLPNTLTLADAANSIGRPIAISEAWAFKVRDSELGVLSYNDVYARDVFSFWAPIDQQFLSAIFNLSQYKRAIFASAPWPRYFFAYLDYAQVGGQSTSELLLAEGTAAGAAIASASFTSTGLYWENLILPSADQTAPQVPAQPATVIGADLVSLSWNAVTDNVGVAGYRVYRNGALAATVVQPTWGDKGLANGALYTYSLVAFDASGNQSAPSTPLTVRTLDTQAPTVPTGVRVTGPTVTSLTLSWNPSTDNVGVVGYRIMRGTSPSNLTGIANVPCCSYIDTGLAANTTYYYAVAAYDATQRTSANSTTVQGTTLRDVTPPTVPANVSARALSQTQVNVTWSASTDDTRISNYKVYRGKTATSMVQIGASTTTSYLDTKAVANTTYYYSVQASDINGNSSAQSPAVSVKTLP